MADTGRTAGPGEDIVYGFAQAKQLASMDIGQTVVVRRRTILAVEALEGTDATIRRGCAYGRSAVVVKVNRRQQDMRFDVPVVGPHTLAAAAEGRAGVLAVEAGTTVMLHLPGIDCDGQRQSPGVGRAHAGAAAIMRRESVMDSHAQDAPLLIIAGETSGDQHGAAMARVLREDFPDLSIFGVGGEHMRAAGVETLFDVEALNVVGLVEVLAKVPSGLLMARRLLQAARERGVRVVVLIDAPGFNLPFARWAKQAGLQVVYYVSPQIWAWRQNRIHKVARRVDKMLTLFPFEVPFYAAAGVDAEYVGHPLLDCLPGLPDRSQAAQTLGLDTQRPIVALLPGSRRREVELLLQPMLAALSLIRHDLPEVQGVLPVAPTVAETVQQIVSRVSRRAYGGQPTEPDGVLRAPISHSLLPARQPWKRDSLAPPW